MSDLIERQAAIDAVRRSEALDRAFGYGHAVDALRELPSVQPEKRTDKHTETHACDCISRQGAIDADELMELLTTAIRNMKGIAKLIGAEDDPEIKMKIKAYTDIANWVKDAPTIEPERKPGKWILADTYDGRKRYRCSECLSFALKTDDGQENLSDYCPVCGARMEGGDDGTD